jgi:thiamine monophosphate kinase
MNSAENPKYLLPLPNFLEYLSRFPISYMKRVVPSLDRTLPRVDILFEPINGSATFSADLTDGLNSDMSAAGPVLSNVSSS